MKLSKKLGSEDVQDLIREACARAAELPRINFRDPWPNDRLLQVEAMPERVESDRQPGHRDAESRHQQVTIKFRKKLGSEDVQDLIREACARAAELPRIDLHDPWPSDRLLQVKGIPAEAEPTKQNE